MPQSSEMTSVLSQLAEMATGYVLTPDAEQGAREAIFDTVASAAAAPHRDLTAALVQAYGPGSSRIWFSGATASPVAAGFANALMSAVLDLDDGHRKSRGHPGAVVVPAVLAEADRMDAVGHACSDQDILRAIAVGYEVGLRVASARSFYARTGFWGGFAAAAGVGALAHLTAPQLANAIAIAGETGPHMATTTMPPAWPQPNGSDVKEGIPWGVATGIAAVPMAQAGVTGARDLVNHAPFFDADAILADRPGPAICETYTKFHAACRHVHAPVEAFHALVRQHGLAPQEIEKVEVAAYSGALRIPNRTTPRNLVDAQYSIPYCIALVALHGAEVLLPMTESALDDPEAEALATRVQVFQHPPCEARFPAETPVIVTVHARGAEFASEITTPSGEADQRPSWDARLTKFRVATRDALAPATRTAFEDAFQTLQSGSLSPLRDLLAQAAKLD